MGQDQRRHPRFSIRLHVTYQDTEREIEVSSRDISLGGIFLATSRPAEPGTAVSVSVELPDRQGTVWATGRVVHCLPGRGMGIALERFGPGSRERLEAFLASLPR